MTDADKATAMRRKLSLAAELLYTATPPGSPAVYELAHHCVNTLSTQSERALALIFNALNEVK
jgi:hypothetical protein